MNQSTTSNIKQRLTKYGLLIAYSCAGLVGLGLFSFKIITARIINMENSKTKSKNRIVHKNMKQVMIMGIVGTALYTYGLWQIIKRIPESNSHQQMGDYNLLSQGNRKSPQMQDHYIIKTMRMFGVSQQLITKTKQEFQKINSQNPDSIKQKPNLTTQMLWALVQRKKVEKKHEQSQKNK